MCITLLGFIITHTCKMCDEIQWYVCHFISNIYLALSNHRYNGEIVRGFKAVMSRVP